MWRYSHLESVNSLDGCDSDEEVVHADNISALLAQVSATASEQMLFQWKIIFLQKTYGVYNLYKRQFSSRIFVNLLTKIHQIPWHRRVRIYFPLPALRGLKSIWTLFFAEKLIL